MCPRSRLGEVYSEARFAKVLSILRARDWVLPMYGLNHDFLAPLVDMFNFGQVGVRVHFDDRKHSFVVRATQPIKAGSEILFYYGRHCLEEGMDMYGFATSEGSCQKSKPAAKQEARRLHRAARAAW